MKVRIELVLVGGIMQIDNLVVGFVVARFVAAEIHAAVTTVVEKAAAAAP